jgi:hypothetical protein
LSAERLRALVASVVRWHRSGAVVQLRRERRRCAAQDLWRRTFLFVCCVFVCFVVVCLFVLIVSLQRHVCAGYTAHADADADANNVAIAVDYGALTDHRRQHRAVEAGRRRFAYCRDGVLSFVSCVCRVCAFKSYFFDVVLVDNGHSVLFVLRVCHWRDCVALETTSRLRL